MHTALTIFGLLLLGGGAFLMAVAALGVAKLPDLYCRAHAVGKALTLGVVLVLLALGVLVDEVAWWKIGVAVAFQLATTPVASHLFCLVAYRKRVKRWSAGGWVQD